jgi:antitoxin component of RelBE/YafQ-DinJ toxin-antitoxin module
MATKDVFIKVRTTREEKASCKKAADKLGVTISGEMTKTMRRMIKRAEKKEQG